MPAEWGARVLSAVLVAILGGFAVTFSLAQTLSMKDQASAHRLAPYDGRITARLAASLAQSDEASAAERSRADALARAALRREPTAITAVSTLGLDAAVRNDVSTARRLFFYAQRLSRRDLATQLWLIEDAVARGDIAGALRHYDIALRTNISVSDLLFPVLSSASASPDIRRALVHTLANRPPWGERYVAFVAASGARPDVTATLFLELRHLGVAVPASAQTNTVNALLSSGSIDRAWAYYAAIRPGADRRRSRDASLSGVAAPSQLDWIVGDDEGITATLQDGRMDFAAPQSVGGTLMRQQQLLPPGEYRLSGHSEQIEPAAASQLYWTLACQDGTELGRAPVPASDRSNGRFAGMFRVPPGCPVQVLSLVALPSEMIGGVSGLIDHVELAPVR